MEFQTYSTGELKALCDKGVRLIRDDQTVVVYAHGGVQVTWSDDGLSQVVVELDDSHVPRGVHRVVLRNINDLWDTLNSKGTTWRLGPNSYLEPSCV